MPCGGRGAAAAEVDRARPAALDALAAHRDWLAARLAELSAAESRTQAGPATRTASPTPGSARSCSPASSR